MTPPILHLYTSTRLKERLKMHEKKAMKSYGGLEKNYEQEMASVTFGSMALAMAVGEVVKEMYRDDSDRGDIQPGWLNGPYQLMQRLEREVAELESKVKADPQFSDKFKQMLVHDLFEPVKDGNRKARAIDDYVMNGTVPTNF